MKAFKKVPAGFSPFTLEISVDTEIELEILKTLFGKQGFAELAYECSIVNGKHITAEECMAVLAEVHTPLNRA